jgi:2-dehydro-3-deoxyphosphogluconate aldolase/(4S)-4-hydroxy-2-oxoglutarate aldolase
MVTDRQNTPFVDEFCKQSPKIPVVAIQSAADAVPLANALIEGGINVIEITLRTDAALESIQNIAREVPKMSIAAGTVLNPHHYQQAIDAGAKLIISPGITQSLLLKGQDNSVPLLPGVSSASELMQIIELGYSRCKFFPATAAGSHSMLNALKGPFEHIKFCPTGGITLDNAQSFLSLTNVICVGGSWLSPIELVKEKRWKEISKIAKDSLASCKG